MEMPPAFENVSHKLQQQQKIPVTALENSQLNTSVNPSVLYLLPSGIKFRELVSQKAS